ncbi:MAG: hypothetical protein WDO15_29615 [Bacteroidota bacterium]
MQRAHDWAVAKYTSWNIPARNEKWGEWRGWERGITHIDMVSPMDKDIGRNTACLESRNTQRKTRNGRCSNPS